MQKQIHHLKRTIVIPALLAVVVAITPGFRSADTRTPQDVIAQAQLLNVEEKSISDQDAARYRDIFALQNDGNWNASNAVIAKLENPVLLGHVLAQRYLHRDYRSTKDELQNWLTAYSDLPQAPRLYQLARSRGVHADVPQASRHKVSGYGDSMKSVRQESPRIAGDWKAGLSYFHSGKYEQAHRIFSSLERNAQSMGDWDRAAFSFWAYRAAHEMDDDSAAKEHLKLAAQFPRSFYGAQAVELLGDSLDETLSLRGKDSLDDYLESVESAEIRKALRRAEGLLASGQNELAQEEVMQHYARAEPEERVAFIHLMKSLNLPAMQLRMGVDLERKGITSGEALYPLPQWEPAQGFVVDPALVFAIARQESGFNNKVRSYAGAQGAMQIMPQTAQYIARSLGAGTAAKLNDPVNSVEMGQNYLRYLAEKPYIQGNLVLLVAAYNAGPANAKRWAQRPSAMSDPLYFVETLPFSETRDYVMNVMTNYWMYREIMGQSESSIAAMSKGEWPLTTTRNDEVASTDDLGWQISLQNRS